MTSDLVGGDAIDWTNGELVERVQFIVDVLAGRWSMPILAILRQGARRHSELRRSLRIHHGVLDGALRRLEDRRLVIRETNADRVVHYRLSAEAYDLMGDLEVLLGWTRQNPRWLRTLREHAESGLNGQ